MTPERKKKLRVLLRKMAAEQLKKEQEIKAQERRRAITERCGTAKSLDGANEAALIKIIQEYQNRMIKLEDAKYDLEYAVRSKEFEINELNIQMNDLKGKFMKPILKKVAKYDSSKFQKAKLTELDFRATLKNVSKDKFKLDDEEGKEVVKPEWALGAKEAKEKAEGEE